jgi:hypothetical protein
MKIVQSAFIPTEGEVKIVSIGQGAYSVENVYSGTYEYFRYTVVESLMIAPKAEVEPPIEPPSDLSLQIAGQVWCTEKNKNKQMDPDLAMEFARQLDVWIEFAAQQQRNTNFYMGILDECAEKLGAEAYTSDDGSVQDSPVRLKIPELIAKLK